MVAGIIGFVIGVLVGVTVMCCLVAAGSTDDRMEKPYKDNKADSE